MAYLKKRYSVRLILTICIISVVVVLISIYAYFGYKEFGCKEYFVRPCEFICDYQYKETTKWAITCRAWGLMKYYHPNVTAGKIDWDSVLIERIEGVDQASS